jgi:hypothetical protein
MVLPERRRATAGPLRLSFIITRSPYATSIMFSTRESLTLRSGSHLLDYSSSLLGNAQLQAIACKTAAFNIWRNTTTP